MDAKEIESLEKRYLEEIYFFVNEIEEYIKKFGDIYYVDDTKGLRLILNKLRLKP